MSRGIGHVVDAHGSGGAIVQNVLIVEDNTETSDYLKKLLERNGFQVRVARDGGQAHSTFAMYKPDLVILDLILPGESGFEICERLKSQRDAIPVMMLSAIDLESSRNLAAKVGADGYLTKPIRESELLSTIKTVSESSFRQAHRDRSKDEGAIRFSCRCGKRFKVSIRRQGKLMNCTSCGESVTVPRN
ncbi:MAG: response regulator [Planctomyces sp.]|jgi:two-component system response regulator RegX3|nr:response regulator [Planctomyces sp.]